MTIGYLLSEHPTPGHGFMLREITRLRQRGVRVEVAAIRPPRPAGAPDSADPDERQAQAETFYVTRVRVLTIARAHLHALWAYPVRYLRTLLYAVTLGRWHPRRTTSALIYFVEAVIAGDWLRSRGVSHVHAHFSSTVAMLSARVWPLTLSITFHGPDEFDAPSADLIGAKVAASAFVVAISQFAKSQLMRRSAPEDWPKIEVVPLGVDPFALAPEHDVGAPGSFRFVCAGRLAPVKGHRVLLAAMARLKADATHSDEPHSEVVLHIAGDGPERARLQRIVARLGLESQVIFEGLLRHDALVDLYRSADAFVLPTFAEGVPVVLMEAMALEVPCLSTWVDGVPELIEHEKSGLLVPPGDEDALASAMRRLARDRPLARALGRQGRLAVIDRYDVNQNVQRLMQVFTRRLGEQDQSTAVRPAAAAVDDAKPSGLLGKI